MLDCPVPPAVRDPAQTKITTSSPARWPTTPEHKLPPLPAPQAQQPILAASVLDQHLTVSRAADKTARGYQSPSRRRLPGSPG
jgi:hypothetical protein